MTSETGGDISAEANAAVGAETTARCPLVVRLEAAVELVIGATVDVEAFTLLLSRS